MGVDKPLFRQPFAMAAVYLPMTRVVSMGRRNTKLEPTLD